jgi:chemotaxis protein MotB
MSENHKREEEEHADETWLIPYSDLLTLLLALFIVLFASSSIDAKKFSAMVEAFSSIFHSGTGIVDVDPKGQEKNTQYDANTPEEKVTPPSIVKGNAELLDLKSQIDKYIEENKLTEDLETTLSKQYLMITIRDYILFDSGSAEIKPAGRKLIKPIGDLLSQYNQYEVLIMGHTDNRPINTKEFPSNWELSSQRALNFMKFLLENPKLDPARFGAIGHAEYRPIDTNATEAGRAKNRRVEIAIIRAVTSSEP